MEIMMWSRSLKSLIDQSLKRAAQFEERLKELRSERFASEAPIYLLDFLDKFNDEIRYKLENLGNNIGDDIDHLTYITISKQIRMCAEYLAEYYPYTTFIESSRAAISPPGILVAIERLTQEIVSNQKVTCLVCPSYICNYFFLDFADLKDNFLSEKLFNDFPIIIFGFPFVIKNDILCHSIIGHELGHFAGRVMAIFDNALLRGLTLSKALPLKYSDLRKFFEEYVADSISVYLFGPSMLFASMEFGISISEFTAPSYTHPPLILRVKNMLEDLGEYGYNSIFNPEDAENRLLKDLGQLVIELYEDVDSLSKDIFDSLHGSLSAARKLIKEKIMPPAKIGKQQYEQIKDLVIKGIPPSSLSDRLGGIDLGTILSVGWFHKLLSIHEETSLKPMTKLQNNDYLNKLKDLSRLIGKAVQDSEILIWSQKNVNKNEGKT